MSKSLQADLPPPSQTLVLTRQMIADLMVFEDYVTAVEGAFRSYSAGTILVPEVIQIPTPNGAFHIKSARLTEDPFYVAVKVNGNFPDNRQRAGMPTIQGAITLCDGKTGFPLAILDSTEVTAQRTAAATAVAAKHLAKSDSNVATVIGCGIQGRMQLQALLHVLPLTRVYAFDIDTMLCKEFAEEMTARTAVPVTALRDFVEGTQASQVIVTCTSSRAGFLQERQVQSGVFIAAVGADNYDKQELDPDLMQASKVVVDILEQCAQIGELHHALTSGRMERSQVSADLGDVVSGTKVCRTSPEDIIIFDSTGSAIQDVAAAGMIYERAREEGLGLPVVLA